MSKALTTEEHNKALRQYETAARHIASAMKAMNGCYPGRYHYSEYHNEAYLGLARAKAYVDARMIDLRTVDVQE